MLGNPDPTRNISRTPMGSTMPGRRFETDGIAECDAAAEQLAQQAWQGRMDWGEERAARKAALACCRDCSLTRPRGARRRRFHAFGGGCKPSPEVQEERHQHRVLAWSAVSPGSCRCGIPYQFQSVGGSCAGAATAGIQPVICARPLPVASTFQRSRWQCVD